LEGDAPDDDEWSAGKAACLFRLGIAKAPRKRASGRRPSGFACLPPSPTLSSEFFFQRE